MAAGSGAFDFAAGAGLVDSLHAFEQVQAELAGVSDEELVPINIDILIAVTTVLGVVGELRGFRAELVAKLPAFDVERFDRLEVYARAAGHAHALHLQVTSNPDVAPLVDAASALREQLLSDATALARRGLIAGQALESLKGPVGYRNLAFDLSALSSMLRGSWSKLEGKTAIQQGELEQARFFADQLLTAVGLREQGPTTVSASALTRQRAFTLLVKAYNQTRRGIAYLRWDEGDLDRIAPSLYERRASRRRPSEPEQDEASELPMVPRAVTVPPAAVNGAGKLAGSSGLPGESPFEEP